MKKAVVYIVLMVQWFKGTVPPKNYKFSENFILLLMKYQHVADDVMEFYSSVTCVRRAGRG